MAIAMTSGRLASLDVGGSTLPGVMNFAHSGGQRNVIEAPPTFDADYIERLGGQLIGGEIEVSGTLADKDDGVFLALIAAFHAATAYTHDGIKFFLDATDYWTPEETLVPASSVWLTKCPDAFVHDASGVCQISMTFVVNGQLEFEQP